MRCISSLRNSSRVCAKVHDAVRVSCPEKLVALRGRCFSSLHVVGVGRGGEFKKLSECCRFLNELATSFVGV